MRACSRFVFAQNFGNTVTECSETPISALAYTAIQILPVNDTINCACRRRQFAMEGRANAPGVLALQTDAKLVLDFMHLSQK
jgi:hypothetical protein